MVRVGYVGSTRFILYVQNNCKRYLKWHSCQNTLVKFRPNFMNGNHSPKIKILIHIMRIGEYLNARSRVSEFSHFTVRKENHNKVNY